MPDNKTPPAASHPGKFGKTRKSLAVTIATAFLSLSLVTLLVSTGLETFFNFELQRDSILYEQYFVAEEAAEAVEDFIERKFSILALGSQFINTGDDQGNKELILQKMLGQEQAFRNIVLLDNDGKVLAHVSRVSQVLSRPFIEDVLPNHLLKHKGKDRGLSDVYIQKVTSEPMIAISASVKDIFGDRRGTIVAEVNLKFMWDLVGSLDVAHGGVAYVVDRSGRLIGYGDPSRVLKGEDLSHLEEVAEFINESENFSFTHISRGINGDRVVAEHQKLEIVDWAVVAESPASKVYSGVMDIMVITLLIIAVSLILVTNLALYLSRRISKPVTVLRNAVEELMEGKMGARTDIKVENEIGDLAVAFNEMAGRLEASYRDLETKVKERTEELRQKMEDSEKLSRLMIGREVKMIELKDEIRSLKERLGLPTTPTKRDDLDTR